MSLKNGFRWASKPPLGYYVDTSHPLARGLIGAWLFNEGGGPPRNLLTGVACTTAGNPTWSAGRWGAGQQFNAAGATGQTTDVAATLNDFTCLGWFNSPAAGQPNERLVDKSYSTGFWLGRRSSLPNTWG